MSRKSPMLASLPRREGDGPPPPIRVKLRRSTHRGARRPVPEIFTQLTVPAPYADRLPDEGVIFELTMEGTPGAEVLRYTRVDG